MFFLSLFDIVHSWWVLVLILFLTAAHALFRAPELRGLDAAPGRSYLMRVRRRGGWLWRVPSAA